MTYYHPFFAVAALVTIVGCSTPNHPTALDRAINRSVENEIYGGDVSPQYKLQHFTSGELLKPAQQ